MKPSNKDARSSKINSYPDSIYGLTPFKWVIIIFLINSTMSILIRISAFLVIVYSSLALATAAPVGIFFHAYSPETPAEKIESAEFEKMEKDSSGMWFYLANGRAVLVTDYKFRGVLKYAVGLTPSDPEFAKYLKLYEEKANAIPTSRPFLNPRIIAMRSQAAEFAKQSDAVAKLPTITLGDGNQLRGCVLTKVESGSVTIQHQEGVKTMSISDLDDAEKNALSATSEIWSLETPSVTPQDSSGTYAKIVLQNGIVLKNVKFKELAQGKMIFTADKKIFTVSLNQLPVDYSALGEEVVKLLAIEKNKSLPTKSVASGGTNVFPTNPQREKNTPLTSEAEKKSAHDNQSVKKTKSLGSISNVEKSNDPVGAEDQFNLGISHAEGKGVAKDEAKAAYWFRKSADQGYAKAQVVLGTFYAGGIGLPKDEAEAVKWWRKGAVQGLVEAQYLLGVYNSEGKGIPKNDAEAFFWWKKAAEQGNVEAQGSLGVCYADGKGVSQNDVMAFYWWRKAANQGAAWAQLLVATSYVEGKGVTKDETEAINWYRKAADQGVAEAQVSLGTYYVSGDVVPKNNIQACVYFLLAADQGDQSAIEFLAAWIQPGSAMDRKRVD